MSPILIVAAAVAAAVLVAVLIAVAVAFGPAQRARALQKRIEAREVREYEVHEKLKEHTKEFRKEVVEVSPGVHVAVGFGLANCVLIEGEEGCVLIDALESVEAADEAVATFRPILDRKPIKTIIITHFHTDHSYGIEAFVRGREGEVKIYAHDTYDHHLQELSNVRVLATFKRSMRQFGALLKKGEHENSGIGPCLKVNKHTTESKDKSATHVFSDRLTITECGLTLELIHSPGETNDQVNIWWPDRKIFFPGDNIYRAFPNLYAIRGTASRDTMLWTKAVDLMRSYEPEILVPQHTRPLVGKEVIMETLTAYRDGIQFVHDQTLRYINKGYDIDRIASLVKLPPTLAEHPYLLEFYGSVDWSVRAVFSHYLGCGQTQTPHVHLRSEELSERLVRLAGGVENCLEQAKDAADKGELKWALKMADVVLDCRHNDDGNLSSDAEQKAKEIKSRCLRALGEKEISANGRNWYFTAALENEGYVVYPDVAQVKSRVYLTKMIDAFRVLTIRLCPIKSQNAIKCAVFYFTDIEEFLQMQIRRGVAEVVPIDTDDADLRVTTTSRVWQEVCARDRSPMWAYITGEMSVSPTIFHLALFMSYFDTKM